MLKAINKAQEFKLYTDLDPSLTPPMPSETNRIQVTLLLFSEGKKKKGLSTVLVVFVFYFIRGQPVPEEGEEKNQTKKNMLVLLGHSFNKGSTMECPREASLRLRNYPGFQTVHPVLPILWFQINLFPFEL